MRILHTGDLHLDSAFCAYGQKDAERQREAGRELLEEVFACAKREGCEMILIAGDLFDSAFVSPQSARLFERLVTDSDIHVVISPGNHDFYTEGGFYAKMRDRLCDKLTVFSSNELQVFDFDELRLRVFGYAFTSMALLRSPLSEFRMPEDNGYTKILCAHADLASPVSRYAPLTLSEIEACGFDYTALGHIHNRGEREDAFGKVRYCGFAEGRSFDELGAGRAWIVDVEGGELSCRAVDLSKRAFYISELDVSDVKDKNAAKAMLADKIKTFAARRGAHLRLVLEGWAEEELIEHLLLCVDELCAKSGLEYLELRDSTLPYIDGAYLERDTTLRGELYRTLLPKLLGEDAKQRDIATRALRIGLAAIDSKNIFGVGERK